MEKYRVSNVEAITSELIQALIERYKIKEVPRLKKLHNYYLNQPDIRNREMSDVTKPNNQIASPHASFIVDIVQGYYMGVPIAYSSEEKELMEKIQAIHDKNHEASHNSKMAKQLSIAGVGYELLYMNEENQIKMAMVNPEEAFIIFDNTIECNPLAAVWFKNTQDYVTEEVATEIEVYTVDEIKYATMTGSDFTWGEAYEHLFNKVPMIQYLNNDEATGDFEKVIDLINAYDLAVSDTSNNLEYFADAYLVLSGLEGTDEEDVADMKENRVMILGEGGKAEWLVKGAQNMEVESYKNRLKEDIHTLSSIPNLGDESFGNASSGESLKYKLFGLENLVAIKERNFTHAIEQRLELMANILNLKGGDYDTSNVTLTYTRSLPSNITTTVDAVSKLSGLISHETMLTLLPFIDDPALELEKLKAEKEGSMYEDFFTVDEEEPIAEPAEPSEPAVEVI